MFLYGYDEKNLYVFDTHQANKIRCEKITSEPDNRFIMRLPIEEIGKGLTKFNRVWIIKKEGVIENKDKAA